MSTEYLFLTCFADYLAQEFLLGTGPPATTTLQLSHDRQGEARSHELYVRAHAAGEFGGQELLGEPEYVEYLSQLSSDTEFLLSLILECRESVVFLAPMAAHNTTAIEVWHVVAQWAL